MLRFSSTILPPSPAPEWDGSARRPYHDESLRPLTEEKRSRISAIFLPNTIGWKHAPLCASAVHPRTALNNTKTLRASLGESSERKALRPVIRARLQAIREVAWPKAYIGAASGAGAIGAGSAGVASIPGNAGAGWAASGTTTGAEGAGAISGGRTGEIVVVLVVVSGGNSVTTRFSTGGTNRLRRGEYTSL
ncbi:hypothetical protein ACXR0O_00745 [Verrucomicrobiota bacterium sgz303538]